MGSHHDGPQPHPSEAPGTVHRSHKKQYFFIFLMLTALTVVELLIPDMKGLSSFAKSSSLTVLAVGKCFLVGYFFMHLNHETKWLKFVALIPIAAVLYTVMVVVEALIR
jgi:cytochrome c oxidase subunit 4